MAGSASSGNSASNVEPMTWVIFPVAVAAAGIAGVPLAFLGARRDRTGRNGSAPCGQGRDIVSILHKGATLVGLRRNTPNSVRRPTVQWRDASGGGANSGAGITT